MVDMTTKAVEKTFEHEKRTVEIMMSNIKGNSKFVDFMNKRTSTAVIDGFMVFDELLAYGIEQKSRNITAALLDEWHDELIINWVKLNNLQQFAKLSNLPVHLWTYLIPDDVVIDTMICDANGDFTTPIRIEHGKYQESANGGHIIRNVAYIDASASHHYRFQSQNQTDTSQPFSLIQRFHAATE